MGYSAEKFDHYVDIAQEQMALPQVTMQTLELEEEDNLANELLQTAIDYNAGWYVLGFAVVGAGVVLKNKIKKWLLS